MKNLKLFVAALLVVVFATVCVSAATVTYDFNRMNETSDFYLASFHYDMEKEVTDATYSKTLVGTFTTRFTFNSDKLILISTLTGEPVEDYVEEVLSPIMLVETEVANAFGSTKYKYNLADPKDNGWTVDEENGKISGYITAYTQDNKFNINDTTVLNVVFALADGVTIENIYEEDFVIDSVYIKDTGNDVAYGYQYTNDNCDETLTVVNNVVNEKPVEVDIPVKAGDVVYKAGTEISPVAIEEDGVYKVFANAQTSGTYVVNSEYTAQKVYNVAADGTVTEGIENGILGDDEVSVRIKDPKGIRFFGTVANLVADTADFEEYGFIMTAESAYNNLGTDYVLDMALVNAGKAKKGVAKGTVDGTEVDKYFERGAESTLIAGVLYGIPMDAESVQTVIASRPYYKIGETYVYGEVTRVSIYTVAKAIYNVEGFEAAWDYAKQIIEIVDGVAVPESDKEIFIDASPLYK